MGRQRRTSLVFYYFCFIVLLCHGFGAGAQVSSMALDKLGTCSFSATVLGPESEGPISFASAYMTQRNDSTICSFCFSDDNGRILLPEVPSGEYVLYVEMLGYEPYAQFVSTKGARKGGKDLGNIVLAARKENLDAAVVTAGARDMTVIKDTVVLNATLFHQSGNDRLVDLLRKMPGMELTGTGVSFNGKPIDNITIGGHTFFLNDPSMALNNLPARIIQNIRIYPEAKRQIMDVVLKNEYVNRIIGSATLSAGYDVEPGTNSSVLGSYFGEKANFAALASAQTMNDPLNASISTVYGGREGSVLGQRSGVEKNVVVGTEIGGVLTLKYNDSRKVVLDSTSQQSYYNGTVTSHEELLSGDARQQQASASFNFSRNTSSGFRLGFSGRVDLERSMESSLSSVNAANGFVSDAISTNASFSAFKALSVPGSILQFILIASCSSSDTDGCDQTVAWKRNSSSYGMRGVGTYRRPFGDHLTLVTKVVGAFNPTRTVRTSDNDSYSYTYDNYLADFTEFLGLDCALGRKNILNVGVNGSQMHASTWNNYVSPVLSYSHKTTGRSFSLEYKGQPSNPDKRYLSRNLDISNPTYGIVGNDGLVSSFRHALSSSLNVSGKRSSVNARISYDLTTNPFVNAIWYDDSGRRYIHPVNSGSPGSNISTSLTFNTKFGTRNVFRLRVTPSFQRSSSAGLLADVTSDIADVESFSYSAFNDWFNTPGNFRRTQNTVSVAAANASMSWSCGGWFSSLSAKVQGKAFSFDSGVLPDANLLDFSLTNETGYSFPSSAELKGQIEYAAYSGYSTPLARPSTIINLSFSYPFRKLTAFVHAVDILDQRNAFTNVVSQSYVSDTRSLVQGRTILAGIYFNFGSKASEKMGQVQSAMMGILSN